MNASQHVENCYQLLPAADSERLRCEFASPAVERWLARLCERGFCEVLVLLMLKLERLVQAPLDGTQRVLLLRRLMTLTYDLADDLPKNPPPAAGVRGELPLSLAQRLCCLIFRNLKRTLEDLDHGGGGLVGERDGGRYWVVAEMFGWLGRQIELGAGWGKTWPLNTWQELHDLFAYCANRLGIGRGGAGRMGGEGAGGEWSFDPETAYKRLLMMGLCAENDAASVFAPAQEARFAHWVRSAELHDSGSYFGVLGTYLVDTSADAPPRLVPGALGPVSLARVLRLPKGFLDALAAARAGRHPFGST